MRGVVTSYQGVGAGFPCDVGTEAQAPALWLTVPCTQNIYISLGEYLYQTVQEVSDAIPGIDATLQTVEGITIINKKEA